MLYNKKFSNNVLVLKKVHIVIKCNQNAGAYIDMNTDRRKKKKNVGKHRGIKLVTTANRRNYFVLEPNYHNAEIFKENILGTQIKKNKNHIDKQRYL